MKQLKLSREWAWAFAGYCRSWSGGAGWTKGGDGSSADFDQAIADPRKGDPFVRLAILIGDGDDLTDAHIAEAFGMIAEAFVSLTGRKGLVGEMASNPLRIAELFDAYAMSEAEAEA